MQISLSETLRFIALLSLYALLPLSSAQGTSDPDISDTVWTSPAFFGNDYIFFKGKAGGKIEFGYIATYPNNEPFIVYEGTYRNGHLSLNNITLTIGYDNLEIDLDLANNRMAVEQTVQIYKSEPAETLKFSATCKNCVLSRFKTPTTKAPASESQMPFAVNSLFPLLGSAALGVFGVGLGSALSRVWQKPLVGARTQPQEEEAGRKTKSAAEYIRVSLVVTPSKQANKNHIDAVFRAWEKARKSGKIPMAINTVMKKGKRATIRGDETDYVVAGVLVEPIEPWQLIGEHLIKVQYVAPGKSQCVKLSSLGSAFGRSEQWIIDNALLCPGHDRSIIRAKWSDRDQTFRIMAFVTAELINKQTGQYGVGVARAVEDLDMIGANPKLAFSVEGNPFTDGNTSIALKPVLELFGENYTGDLEITSPLFTPSAFRLPVNLLLEDYFDAEKHQWDMPRKKNESRQEWYDLRCQFHLQDDKALHDLDNDIIKIGYRVRPTGSSPGYPSSPEAKFHKICGERLSVVNPANRDCAKIKLLPCIIEIVFPEKSSDFLPQESAADRYSPELKIRAKVLAANGKTLNGAEIFDKKRLVKSDYHVDWKLIFRVYPIPPGWPRPGPIPGGCPPKKDWQQMEPGEKIIQVLNLDDQGYIVFQQDDGSTASAYVYNHIKSYGRMPDYGHLRGDGSYVRVSFESEGAIFPIGRGPELGHKFTLKVETADELYQYAAATYGTGEAYRNNTKNLNDSRITWFYKNALIDERVFYADKINCFYEFWDAPTKSSTTIRRNCTATYDYYCHDFAWHPGSRRLKRPHTDAPIHEPNIKGFEYLGDELDCLPRLAGNEWKTLEPGDIVCYFKEDSDKADHSAVVLRWEKYPDEEDISRDDLILHCKDLNNSEFEHCLGEDSTREYIRFKYSRNGRVAFYRKKGSRLT